MKILAKNNNIPMSANLKVKKVGQYLYKHIDGAFKSNSGPNMFDVWFNMLYEIPPSKDPRYKRLDDTLYEIVINLNLTTYQNKVRINIIEVTPNARTLGFDVFLPEQLDDLERVKQMVMERVHQRIAKAYKDYDFVY